MCKQSCEDCSHQDMHWIKIHKISKLQKAPPCLFLSITGCLSNHLDFPGGSDGKESATQETWVWSLGQEDSLEKEMATHLSILAWRMPWTEKLGGLQSMGLQNVGHDWVTNRLSNSHVVWLLSSLILCDPMNRSMPGLPAHHQLPEPTQTHVHCVGDAIQLSHPLLSPSPPAPNLSQHQSLFKWVSSLHQVAKVLEFQLQHQSFQWTPRTDLL